MKVYIGRYPSEEFLVSTLYEDISSMDGETELTDEEYADLQRVNQAYWDWQEKLMNKYEEATR